MPVSIGPGVAFGTGTTGTVTVAVAPLQFTTPAQMNGSTAVAYMRGVTVNSSGLFVAVGYNSSTYPVYATSF